MDDRQREEFNRVVTFLQRNMGHDVTRHFDVGVDYYRNLEAGIKKLEAERDALKHENSMLQVELNRYKLGNATTTEMKSPCSVRGKCRKTDLCENWEPEPSIAVGESGVRGAALVIDHDKKKTERMDAIVEKKSFFGRLFGGKVSV